jgi:hypothetical protein
MWSTVFYVYLTIQHYSFLFSWCFFPWAYNKAYVWFSETKRNINILQIYSLSSYPSLNSFCNLTTCILRFLVSASASLITPSRHLNYIIYVWEPTPSVIQVPHKDNMGESQRVSARSPALSSQSRKKSIARCEPITLVRPSESYIHCIIQTGTHLGLTRS